MMRSLALTALLVAGCGDSDITPDPSGSGASSSSTGTGAQGGTGGSGGNGTGGDGASSQGGNSAPGLGYENGSRLRARNWHADDGSRQFTGWRDTELNVDCDFVKATDGQTRCLPTTLAGGGYYSDPQCTVPLLNFNCAPGSTSLVRLYSASPVCGVFAATTYHVGAPFTGSTIYVNPPTCSASSVPPSLVLYTTSGEEPPSSFVAATESVD